MRECPHEKEQRMKTFAFERWCDQLQLPTATRDFLLHLRSSPPVRRVQGRLLNVCGTYASRKMGVSIQFESHTVELWAIYIMEHDREVLEFFDQPNPLELRYQGPSGRSTKALHTPDFLVLRKNGASFEEWKPESCLLELMVTHPGRYQRDENGNWRCPPGEAAAERLGLSYRVRSSEELHPGYIRNLIFLEESSLTASFRTPLWCISWKQSKLPQASHSLLCGNKMSICAWIMCTPSLPAIVCM